MPLLSETTPGANLASGEANTHRDAHGLPTSFQVHRGKKRGERKGEGSTWGALTPRRE